MALRGQRERLTRTLLALGGWGPGALLASPSHSLSGKPRGNWTLKPCVWVGVKGFSEPTNTLSSSLPSNAASSRLGPRRQAAETREERTVTSSVSFHTSPRPGQPGSLILQDFQDELFP